MYPPVDEWVPLDLAWVLLTSFGVFFMQTGFTLLEVGNIRRRHTHTVLLKNVLDVVVVCICWYPLGYNIAYNKGGAFAGVPSFHVSTQVLPHVFQQFCYASTAVTIVSGAVAERFAILGYVLYSAYVALLVFPIVVHWVWSPNGWLKNMGYHDAAGSSVVHITGGLTGMIAAWLLGARFDRFKIVEATTRRFDPQVGEYIPTKKRVVNQEFPGQSISFRIFGILMLWYSWFFFNAGSIGGVMKPESADKLAHVVTNTILAPCWACLTAFLVELCLNKLRRRSGKRSEDLDLDFIANSILSALVAITAGCDVVFSAASIPIGVIAALLYLGCSNLLLVVGIDDPLNITAVHFVGGVWGVLATGLFHRNQGWFTGGGVHLFVVQCIGVVAISAWVSVWAYAFFSLLKWIAKVFNVSCFRVQWDVEAENMELREFRMKYKQMMDMSLPLLRGVELPNELEVQKLGFTIDQVPTWREFMLHCHTELFEAVVKGYDKNKDREEQMHLAQEEQSDSASSSQVSVNMSPNPNNGAANHSSTVTAVKYGAHRGRSSSLHQSDFRTIYHPAPGAINPSGNAISPAAMSQGNAVNPSPMNQGSKLPLSRESSILSERGSRTGVLAQLSQHLSTPSAVLTTNQDNKQQDLTTTTAQEAIMSLDGQLRQMIRKSNDAADFSLAECVFGPDELHEQGNAIFPDAKGFAPRPRSGSLSAATERSLLSQQKRREAASHSAFSFLPKQPTEPLSQPQPDSPPGSAVSQTMTPKAATTATNFTDWTAMVPKLEDAAETQWRNNGGMQPSVAEGKHSSGMNNSQTPELAARDSSLDIHAAVDLPLTEENIAKHELRIAQQDQQRHSNTNSVGSAER